MNKTEFSCDVIQDLCLLYSENLCSSDSRELIQEHISECEVCRRRLDEIEHGNLREKPDSGKNWILLLISAVFLLSAIFIFINKEAVFQEGNPLRYGKSFIKLAVSEPYVDISGINEIGEKNTRFLTRREDTEELFAHIEQLYHVKYEKELNNGYLFSDEDTTYLLTREDYLKFFTVWDIGMLQ